jgi:hypothetical protein
LSYHRHSPVRRIDVRLRRMEQAAASTSESGNAVSWPAATAGGAQTGLGLAGRALASLAVYIGGAVLAAGSSLVVARLVGAAGYGAYAWARSVTVALAMPAAAGLQLMLAPDTAVLAAHQDWSALRSAPARLRSPQASPWPHVLPP